MQKQSKPKEVNGLLAILTVVFGLFVRAIPAWRSDFPLTDGGMFYVMIRDLQAADFALPTFTSFNHAQIPFAYPPFGFYFTAALNHLTGIPLLKLIQWQPVVINALTIPIVYLFAKRLTHSSTRAWLAIFIYALIPNSYWWQIVGGGITRSFGGLFAFSFVYFAYRIYHDKDDSRFALTGMILSGALVVISHLEWALQAAFVGLLFLLFWGLTRFAVRKTLISVLAILGLTSFWWLTILGRHGLQVFLTASTATENRLLFFRPLLGLKFTGEITTFIAIFVLLGGFVAIIRKDYLLLIWGVGSFLVDPRSAVYASVVPFSILAMYSISDLIAPYLLQGQPAETRHWWQFLDLRVGKLFFGLFAILCLSQA